MDEINRESQTDEKTIIISYLFMFIYIALLLGRFRSLYTIIVNRLFTSILVFVVIITVLF